MNANPRPRRLLHSLLALCALAAFAGFVALGNWQVERRAWKLELIERVEARVAAPATAPPVRADWPSVSRDSDEYRHVLLRGRFLPQLDTRVASATELGTGYWILSPLQLGDGSTVLVNRGFVHQGDEPAPVPAGEVAVSGLLRISEPGGGVLRDNVQGENRWYSRDVAAIAKARGLDDVAPYFVDAAADTAGSPGGAGPVGGLTVIQFHNSHLVYAITWYGLALMVAGAVVLVRREARRRSP
ncbi:SURF1 family protein [Parahaliea mediterranea]|uniref:SURF1 family protein n=1 Tax=Parahaliea mediterranea TaxID=651086 RepID=UPI001F4D4666|nr:SURF1 family protein [Parahaliea mediterranea]